MTPSRTARALLALVVAATALAAACAGPASGGSRAGATPVAGDATPAAAPARSPGGSRGPGPAGAAGTPRPAPDEPGPDDALAAYVTAELQREYAGECLDARLPDDAGKVCAVLVAQAGRHRAYLAGRAFSEPTFWVFLRRGPPWTVYDTAPFDPFQHRLDDIPWPDAAPPANPPDLRTGMTVRVHGTGSCLPVREQPAGRVVGCLDEGAAAVLDGGPQRARLYDWWHLEGRGWAPAPYLLPG